ncbi:MAG: hypothetical protein SGI99_05845 [Pseudomonadota bacterium]|nr:hypothetical protein [Pseudomonadota bacterium]
MMISKTGNAGMGADTRQRNDRVINFGSRSRHGKDQLGIIRDKTGQSG